MCACVSRESHASCASRDSVRDVSAYVMYINSNDLMKAILCNSNHSTIAITLTAALLILTTAHAALSWTGFVCRMPELKLA